MLLDHEEGDKATDVQQSGLHMSNCTLVLDALLMCHQERACSPNSVTYLNKSINRCEVLMCHQNKALPTDVWSDKCEAMPMCWKDLLAIIIKKIKKHYINKVTTF